MTNLGLSKILDNSFEFKEIIDCIKDKVLPVNVSGVAEFSVSHLVFSVCKKLGKTALVVTDNEASANKICDDLQVFYKNVIVFPHKDLIFYNIEAVANDITTKRLSVLHSIVNSTCDVVVASVDALLSPTADIKKYISNVFEFNFNNTYDTSEIIYKFVLLGYTREEMVEGKGQFSVRGDIIDFFPPYSDNPYRVELAFDEVDSIRTFDVSSQRSLDKFDTAFVTPATENILSNDDLIKLVDDLKEYLNTEDDVLRHNLQEDIDRLENGVKLYSIDKYLPLIYEKTPCLLDYISKDSLVFLAEPTKIGDTANTEQMLFYDNITSFVDKGIIPQFDNYRWRTDFDDLLDEIKGYDFLGLFAISRNCPYYKPKKLLTLTTTAQASFRGKIEFFVDTVKSYKNQGYATTVLAGNEAKAKNIVTSLNDFGIDAIYKEEILTPPEARQIFVTTGVISKGFEYPLIKQVILSDREFFGTDRKKKKYKTNQNQERIKSFTDLSVGDFVVHQSHGIGRFDGIVKMEVDGSKSDYLKVSFKDGDCLYVPTNQLSLIYKYIGKDGAHIKLNKLGGNAWALTKQKVKKNCEEMASKLIELYVQRQEIEGIQFSKNTEWHKDFAATFQYEETDDQIRAIEEVEQDMEKSRPMDRLLCGDVGYGKTEIALRAAFKAVSDGYQVAYLVPTTILASQHYNTFCQRMKDFPVKVEMLSRFRSKKEQQQTVKNIENGMADIVIGTHRIIQKDIKFKKLGLLIIDEEQRFGVAHKETLKELKKNVDVLTLSATPIPRTLHMSMVGIRDMSVLENPPKDRYPVSTYVLEYNFDIVKDAILKEIARGGQVYYLHNKVESIELIANKIRSFAPDINVAVAHGKMTETQLENIMQQVLEQEVDVLVCTTIIETGLDIPNVNTIIVEYADRMGLSQLYQLRGRVGRSNKLAYAYLMYKKGAQLSEIAEKRLRAIREFTEFGSGFKIALRDLEIRGAGNVVGAQQHGHMDAVGYDMYCKLLGEAVREVKGEQVKEEIQTTVSLSVDAYIPDKYIKGENYRIEIYKRIAGIVNQQDCYDVYEEIEDRYGEVPLSVSNLIDISYIRSMGAVLGITDITQKDDKVVLVFDKEYGNDFENIGKLCEKFGRALMYSPVNRPYLTLKVKKNEILSNVKSLLQLYKGLKKIED